MRMFKIVRLFILTVIMFNMLHCSIKSDKITFLKYPDIKLGFTTQNFIDCVPVSYDNAIMFLDYAAEKGFSFMELRDPNAELNYDECVKISAHAAEKGIEMAYANQRGLLDPDFWEIFNKGIKNATAFNGTRTYRALISGKNFSENPEKIGLDSAEFIQTIDVANEAALKAQKLGLQLVIENGGERFFDSNDSIFGFEAFFNIVNPNVAWQLDTANPFTNQNIQLDVDTFREYLKANANKIKYVHLKSARNHLPQKVLVKSELDFGDIFNALAINNVNCISIELLVDSDKDEVFKNMDKSIDYLRQEGFVR